MYEGKVFNYALYQHKLQRQLKTATVARAKAAKGLMRLRKFWLADCQKEWLLSGTLPSRRFIMNKKMREWPRLEIRKCCETLEHERVLLVPQYFASSCPHASSMFHAGSPARWAFRPSAEPRTHVLLVVVYWDEGLVIAHKRHRRDSSEATQMPKAVQNNNYQLRGVTSHIESFDLV